jgi:hypothetical protein
MANEHVHVDIGARAVQRRVHSSRGRVVVLSLKRQLDDQIVVAVRSHIAARPTAEQDDTARLNTVDDCAHHRVQ